MQVVQLATLTNEECRSLHTDIPASFIFNSTLCSFTRAGEGICMGDSGGSLVVGGEAVGIASWTIPCASGFPDSWTRVSYYRSWIDNAIQIV